MLASLQKRLTAWSTERGFALPLLSPAAQRTTVPLLLAAAIVTAVVVMLLWQSSGNFRPLFGARENVAVADVVATLEAEGLRYRLHPESGQVLVADGDLAAARMLLAAKGVSAKLPEGLELMDRNDPLGVSQFVQDVRFRRGLEGELARSIATLDAVQTARVHLSIARSSSFVVNTGDKSTASVVLQIKPGHGIQREQIAAIIHMVASSVAGLDPQRVSLTDQAGNFLSARLDLSEGFDPVSHEEQVGQVGEELRRNAHELLVAAVGAGHFRVTIAADVSGDRTEETYEKYTGDPRILNEATREENEASKGVALGVPGSLSNRPINVADDDKKGQDANGNFRAAVSRTFAYDRSVVQVKRAKGRLNRLSVAVVLDDSMAPGEHGVWQPADVQRIEKLLHVGMGIDTARGDQLVVSSMPFRAPEPLPQWWQDPGQWYEWIVTALWVVAAWAVWRLLSRLVNGVLGAARESKLERANLRGESGGASDAVAVPSMQDTPAALPAGGSVAASATSVMALPAVGADGETATASMGMVPLLENVDLPPPGSQVDVMVEHLRSLAAKEPERVAEVVKQWVQKHSQPAGTST